MDKTLVEIDLITVLLPVYNSEKFLKEAIESILIQSYTNFELLIINDGSSDSSVHIINQYSDSRIKLIHNEKNEGLIYTLNKGIDLAKGKYIARMDADDIAYPERLKTQLNYFVNNSDLSVVCSPTLFITEAGNPSKNWDVDINTISEQQIKNTLPKENCIAHPSVMIKTDVAKLYKYNFAQKGSEDWDLWLRLISDKHRIIKTNETLLKYRYVNTSITRTDNKKQIVELKVLKVKLIFLKYQLSKFKLSIIEFKVFYSMLRTIARYLKIYVFTDFLRYVKRVLTINPIKVYKQYNELKLFIMNAENIDMFFFFPYCHIGGAEKVHANIVEVFAKKKCVVFFTSISHKDDFLYLFKNSAPSLNIGYCVNYPFINKKCEKLILNLINTQTNTTVFGCNNLFFYQNILNFKPDVKVFDLMHDFRFEDEYNLTHEFSEQYFRCNKRIFISSKAIEQTKKFYDYKAAPLKEYDKLTLIFNYTDIPDQLPQKNYDSELKVLYVGRGTEEKRAHLFAEIANQCKKTDATILFTAIGDLKNVITSNYKNDIELTGPIHDFKSIIPYYLEFHIIVITSYREGFPLTLMEGMAHGLCPISTPVGDVPFHVNSQNGFVTTQIEEVTTVKEMVNYILTLNINRDLLKEKSINAYLYTKQHFSKETFHINYAKIIED